MFVRRGSGPPSRLRVAATSVAVAGSLLLTGGAGPCSPQSTDSTMTVDYWRSQSPTLRGKDTLKVGVQEHLPLMSLCPTIKTCRGFDIDIAKMIVEKLGNYKIEFVGVKPSQRISYLQDGSVDLVVASFSISDDRKKLVSFAGPYLSVSQEVAVPIAKAGQVTTVQDLNQGKVCTTNDSTSQKRLQAQGVKNIVGLTSNEDCAAGVLRGDFLAMSTDMTILAGFIDTHPDKLALVDMPWDGNEELGIGVPLKDTWLQGLVGDILLESRKQGNDSRWQAAYDYNLSRVLGAKRQPEPKDAQDLIDHEDRDQASAARPPYAVRWLPAGVVRGRRRSA